MSIGKNSLARAAAATGSRATAETAKNPGSFRQVAVDAVVSLKGKQVTGTADDRLVASVQKNGILVPLLLAQTGPEELRVLDGSARLCAARAAGLATVPAVILEMSADQALAACKELSRFAAAPVAATPVSATEVTSVGQAMPDWLL